MKKYEEMKKNTMGHGILKKRMTKLKRTRKKRPQMRMKSKENDAKHDGMASMRRKK